MDIQYTYFRYEDMLCRDSTGSTEYSGILLTVTHFLQTHAHYKARTLTTKINIGFREQTKPDSNPG